MSSTLEVNNGAVRFVDRFDSLILYHCTMENWLPRLVKNQLMAESSMRSEAVSPAGAAGLAQFMPNTWNQWSPEFMRPAYRTNPEASIVANIQYMKHLVFCFGEIPHTLEKLRFALASYNAGRGNVNKALALAREDCGQPQSFSRWKEAGSPPGPWQEWKHTCFYLASVTGRTNSRETLGYVEKIVTEEVAREGEWKVL